MATQAQLDEKARKDREWDSNKPTLGDSTTTAHLAEETGQPSSFVTSYATPAQLSEKARMAKSSSPATGFATEAQLAEKARRDQASSTFAGFATPSQLAEKSRQNPPPLPPRIPLDTPAPPPYSADDAKRSELISEQWRSHDPRSSSTHSLVPSESGRDGRRTMLLVFVHGFMGNETSFQSFPAHIHNLLTITLSETHIVHTKIYPRYQSRKALDFATDAFSTWLEPHENRETDVVLLGHSMGGLLIAEVALQKPVYPGSGEPLRHRILGTINFDTPFLGMHPGVVVSGLGSIFRPAPDPSERALSQKPSSGTATPSMSSQASISSPSYAPSIADSEMSSQLSIVQSITSPGTPPVNDPYFNVPFPNDVRLPERKGWNNFLHFINKHSDGLTEATKQYFMSHIEFGSCMADYSGLKARYARIRALEDVVDGQQRPGQPPAQRVRFVNYYTASTGRPKKPKSEPTEDQDDRAQSTEEERNTLSATTTLSESRSPTPIPSISIQDSVDGPSSPQPENERDTNITHITEQLQDLGSNSGIQNDVQEPKELQHIDSMPIPDDDDISQFSKVLTASSSEQEFHDIQNTSTTDLQPISSSDLALTASLPPLPPIPPEPTEPEPLDLSIYTDKDSLKIAEKEQKRIMRVYQQAIKDRESALKDRKKLLEKREKKAKQEREKQLKSEEKQLSKHERDEAKRLEKEAERMKVEADKLLKIEEKEKQKEVAEAEKQLKKTKSKEKEKGKERERQPSVAESSKSASTRDEREKEREKDKKPKRDKKFCMLPPEYGGKRDKCWVRIYMEGVDEVGAHCGLFFPGPQYESLVGDVGARVQKWLEEADAGRERGRRRD